MKIQSNIPIPDVLKWKDNEMLIAINKKENAVLTEEDEGRRYEADFTIADQQTAENAINAITRMQQDSELDDAVIYGFEIDGKKAISIKKDYATKASASVFPALPASGILEKGEIYSYQNGAVMVVQDHERTIYAPEDTPALFSFYRENTEGQEWIPQESIALNATRTYGGNTYKCIQAHTSQTGWEPDKTPTLWTLIPKTNAWTYPVSYKVGDQVTYNGNTYKCLQAHTSQAGWTPSGVPALWQMI